MFKAKVRPDVLKEVVSVEFSDVALNVPIDDAEFSLEGLGVPKGTPIYDYLQRDEANQPAKSYYGDSLPQGATE